MPDNTQIAGGAGDTVADDELSGTVNGAQQVAPFPKAQRVKPGFGSAHSIQDVDTSSPAHGLPIQAVAGAELDGHSQTIGSTGDASSALTLVGLLKAIKAAITSTISVSQATAADVVSTLTDGRKTVTVAGTAVPLAAPAACKWVTVSALDANIQLVYVGGSDVLAASGTQKGVPLSAGQSVTIPVTNVATVFVDARVPGEGVSFMVGS